MRRSLQFLIMGAAIAATAAVALWRPSAPAWVIVAVAAAALLMLVWVWRSLRRADRVVRTGMELIASQEFGNRLVATGRPETDRIVSLFNTMIDSLRGERIKNLEQENFTSLLIQASPVGVMLLDLDRRVSLVNPALLKTVDMRDSAGILGRKPADIDVQLIREMTAVTLGKSDVIRDAGAMMYRCSHLSFIRNGARCEFYLLESLTEEVMKAEREAYEKVIRTISHEVNNTMGGVRTVLQMMADTSDCDEMADVVESCDKRCDRLCEFVSAYADVVRLPEPTLRPADLNNEVGALVPFLRSMVREGVSLTFEPAPSPAIVSVDTAMLQQVLVNIVKNAAESISAPAGAITISVANEGIHTTLAVTNDGDPISDEVARNLFRPFFTTKRTGRGIGLTLVSEILSRHGARYSLRSVGGLTAFRITF